MGIDEGGRNRLVSSIPIIGIAVGLLCITMAGPAAAEEHTARLWYAVQAGVEGCPDNGAFQDMVSAHVGYVPFAADGELEFDVRVSLGEAGLLGQVTVRGWQQEMANRTFEAAQGECAELTASMALAVALRIDPLAAESAQEPPYERASPPTPFEPADVSPTPPPAPEERPATVSPPGQARLVLRSDAPNVTFYRLANQYLTTQSHTTTTRVEGEQSQRVTVSSEDEIRNYEPLCVAPCEMWVSLGVHRLAVSRGNRRPDDLPDPVYLTGATRVRARVDARRGLRIAGIVIMALGSVSGLVTTVVSGATSDIDNVNLAGIIAGVAVLGLVGGAGALMAGLGSRPVVDITALDEEDLTE